MEDDGLSQRRDGPQTSYSDTVEDRIWPMSVQSGGDGRDSWLLSARYSAADRTWVVGKHRPKALEGDSDYPYPLAFGIVCPSPDGMKRFPDIIFTVYSTGDFSQFQILFHAIVNREWSCTSPMEYFKHYQWKLIRQSSTAALDAFRRQALSLQSRYGKGTLPLGIGYFAGEGSVDRKEAVRSRLRRDTYANSWAAFCEAR